MNGTMARAITRWARASEVTNLLSMVVMQAAAPNKSSIHRPVAVHRIATLVMVANLSGEQYFYL